jgi:hypothetical protein
MHKAGVYHFEPVMRATFHSHKDRYSRTTMKLVMLLVSQLFNSTANSSQTMLSEPDQATVSCMVSTRAAICCIMLELFRLQTNIQN